MSLKSKVVLLTLVKTDE